MLRQYIISAIRYLHFAFPGIRLTFSSNAMTTTAAPKLLQMMACSINFSSPSFREIELTIHLPCTFQTGLNNTEFGRIDHDRNLRNVGLALDEVEEMCHGFLAIE